MRLEQVVGPARYGDDMEAQWRQGNQGETIVGQLNPEHYEQVLRGNGFVYSAAAAGAALAAFGVNSAPFIWNPTGSGKNLVIVKVAVGLASVTATAGHVVYGFMQNMGSQIGTAQPVVSGTFVAPTNLLIGAGNQSVIRFAPTTVTLLAATAATFFSTMGLGQATAATGATSPFMAVDNIDGAIIIPPGCAFVIGASATISTYCTSIYGLELPIPLIS